MSRTAAARLTWFIAGLGLMTTALLYTLFGLRAAQSAGVGAFLALANWFVLRFLVGRVVGGDVRNQTKFSLLLVAKMGALFAIVFVLIKSGAVLAVPFTAGLSSLVVGALLGSFVHTLLAPTASES